MRQIRTITPLLVVTACLALSCEELAVLPDGGTRRTTDGAVVFDAGFTSADAGQLPADSGATAFDAGSPSADAGQLPADSGVTATDAGPTDAGSATDAGSGSDAGTPTTDAGPSADGGVVDAGTPNTGPVRLLFTDLLSGPNQGGENGDGVFVTLFGRGFGASRGTSTVTVGGAEVRRYLSWADTQIAIQLGSANPSGPIVVRTAAGDSVGLPFTVRSGAIRCASPTGSDSASGAFGACWRTWRHAVTSIQAGDTLYFLDGFSQTTDDGTGWNAAAALNVGWNSVSGTPTHPVALVAYPGAVVTIGSVSGPDHGIRLVEQDGVLNSYVFSGLRVRAAVGAMSVYGGDDYRIVNNDISSPNTHSQSGCFSAAIATHVVFLGNNVHDCGTAASDKQDHTVYFTTDTNHVEAAFNRIHDSRACYGIQFHSSPLGAGTGMNQYDLWVHDNAFSGLRCSAVNFATVDPSKGAVRFTHNTVHDVAGQVADDGGSDRCLYVPNYTNAGAAGGGVIDVSGNIFSHCGGGALNLLSGPVTVTDQGNDYFDTTPAPSTNGDFSADPQFADPANRDFDVLSTDGRLQGLGALLFLGP